MYLKCLIFSVVSFVLLFFSLAVYSFLYGSPIHDWGINTLENRFYGLNINHPVDSILLEKIKYLGGNSTHGGGVCVYAIGELRETMQSEQKIRQQYENLNVRFWGEDLQVKLMFVDWSEESYEDPYGGWEGMLANLTDTGTTKYIVYAGSEWPIIIYDYRCDD
ncbi:hypothetical protein A2592_02105 [Candidatus Kaiserbacteria bacterium RIFOXYD1_FULL_42_15]|uniref:Uncharacterized protein n=1 Tax=Candidatus Kaiserbacteria bacterium RIFOXYD1_FULL_42_15 TaxID=1798532 RepID=A0A1F6FPK6_9BACT|nr:MAG: hypothetical protein A2592_02105 [Candidatus Kaiserbacteria bacterium RIFOXYD1_FULL_42_15]